MTVVQCVIRKNIFVYSWEGGGEMQFFIISGVVLVCVGITCVWPSTNAVFEKYAEGGLNITKKQQGLKYRLTFLCQSFLKLYKAHRFVEV